MKKSLKEQAIRLGSLLLPGLAGLVSSAAGAKESLGIANSDPLSRGDRLILKAPLNYDRDNLYAGHSSHRSHSSHSSHYSSSGSYSSPAPEPEQTPAPAPAPSRGNGNGNGNESGNGNGQQQHLLDGPATTKPQRATTDQLQNMIMRVQVALMQRGYDPGAVDGELSGQTSAALKKFQAENQLQANGKMTTETLNALGIKF